MVAVSCIIITIDRGRMQGLTLSCLLILLAKSNAAYYNNPVTKLMY